MFYRMKTNIVCYTDRIQNMTPGPNYSHLSPKQLCSLHSGLQSCLGLKLWVSPIGRRKDRSLGHCAGDVTSYARKQKN